MSSNVFDGWNDAEQMVAEFGVGMDAIEGYRVIVATYDTGNYSGDAFVLLEKNGNYYEVNGSHCSCYGLEDCWELEDVTEAALKIRCESSYRYGGFAMASDAIKEHFGW